MVSLQIDAKGEIVGLKIVLMLRLLGSLISLVFSGLGLSN